MFLEESDKLSDDYSEDETIDGSHNQLLNAVSQLYKKQRVEAPKRREPALEISEFHLSNIAKTESKDDQVDINDLAKTLNTRASHREIGKKLKKIQNKNKTLPKPLEKIHADKISRQVGYSNLRVQLKRWDALVHKNRAADQLRFPLVQEEVKVHEPHDFLTTFKEPTELELKVAELLNISAVTQEDKKIEEEMFPLSLEEIIDRRTMMAHVRAQESYRMAKAARQNKIKSKKFHRIQKHERLKKELKDFEVLQKTDPEAALEKLKQLEKARAEERASLRHRSTGQWARSRAIRAKYDHEARIELSEQLAKSRELTKKRKADSSSEDEGDEVIIDENGQPIQESADASNPWVHKSENEIEEFVSGYRKYWDEKNKENNSLPKNNTSLKEGNKLSGNLEKSSVEDKNDSYPVLINNFDKPNENTDDQQIDNISVKLNHCQSEDQTQECLYVSDIESLEHTSKDNELLDRNEIETISSKKEEMKNINNQQNIPKHFNSYTENVLDVKGNNFQISDKTICSRTKKRSKQKNKTKKSEPLILNLSGSWIVTPKKEITGSDAPPRKQCKINLDKSNIDDIDHMFNDAEDKIQEQIIEHYKNIESNLKSEKKPHKGASKLNKNYEDLRMKKKISRAQLDEAMIELAGETISNTQALDINKLSGLSNKLVENKNEKDPEIDPNKFLFVKPKKLNTQIPDIIVEGDDKSDEEEEDEASQRQMNLMEAFAEDEIVDQFRREKEEDIKESKPGEIDLSLPGWGSWGGSGIKKSKRKKKRFVIRLPELPRKDKQKENVIISENLNEKLKSHLVSEIPFPFTSVKDYEASIRAPIGNTWITQAAHNKLTAPSVVTKLGTPIQPMTKSHLIDVKSINHMIKNGL